MRDELLDEVRAEIEALRAENRRLRRGGQAALLALAAAVGVGATVGAEPGTVEAREVVLVDPEGEPCARWFEQNGDVLLELGRGRDGPPPIQLWADDSGSATLSLAAGDGVARVAALADGTAALALNHGKELGGVSAIASSAGDASLSVQAPGGVPAAGLRAGGRSPAGLLLVDREARERVHVQLAEGDEPLIDCVDAQGRQLFAAP